MQKVGFSLGEKDGQKWEHTKLERKKENWEERKEIGRKKERKRVRESK
jgi:hypothetical protein